MFSIGYNLPTFIVIIFALIILVLCAKYMWQINYQGSQIIAVITALFTISVVLLYCGQLLQLDWLAA
jgi:hypothetical protein